MTPRAALQVRDDGHLSSAVVFLAAIFFLATGCAPKRSTVLDPAFPGGVSGARVQPDTAALNRAAALISDGCYDCLLEARPILIRLQSAAPTSDSTIGRKLFETELLIAVREKELGLDASASIERARLVASRLPDTPGLNRIIAMAEAVLPDPIGTPQDQLRELRVRNSALVSSMGGELAFLAASPLSRDFRDYLGFALDCSYPTRSPAIDEPARPLSKLDEIYATSSPLIQYRVGVCKQFAAPVPTVAQIGGEPVASGELVLAHDSVPRFVETSVWRAIPYLRAAEETGGAEADTLLREAYARFPKSPGITYLLGELNMTLGDWDAALRFFEETIAISPRHEMALVGRTNCLTRMKRDAAAITSATRMIELRTVNVQQAYYFRAVNRHRRGELQEARSDIEMAKTAASTTERAQAEILTLAGIIEHDQDALDEAESDLRRARQVFGGDFNCSAAWYLGRVYVKREGWAEAAGFFETAMRCYDNIAATTVARIDQIRARTQMEPKYQARRIAALEASLPDTRSQFHASAFNAANYLVRAGDKVRAREFLDIAAKDPALAEMVARLREIVG